MYDKNFHLIQKHKVSAERMRLLRTATGPRLTPARSPSPPGDDANRSGMRGVLLHVEKVRALRLLCAAEPLWEEKVQQLSRCNVSGAAEHPGVRWRPSGN